MNKQIINNLGLLLLFALFSAIILIIFPACSTILYPQCVGDYIIFQTIGSGWINGHLPYADLFDHKGPMVFAIYSLGALICKGKLGVWLLELLSVTVSMWMIYQLGRTIGASIKKSVFAVFMSGILLALYIEGGGTVEEFSLPFQILPLLLTTQYLTERPKPALTTIAFCSGICFALTTMIRVNNNVVICGIIIALSIILIKRKEYHVLLSSIGFFLIGLIIGLLPFVIYFLSTGTLEDCIYGTFIYNFKYLAAQHNGIGFHAVATFVFTLLPCVVMCFLGCRNLIKGNSIRNSLVVTWTAVAAVTALVLIQGGDYRHYFIIAIPATACVYYYISAHYARIGG